MGWLFGHYDRKSLVNHLVSGNGVKTLKNCFVGNNMWAVQEYHREGMAHPVRFVCLYMLRGNPRVKHDPCNWGYKDVSEDMGPCQLSCPVSYIELVEAHEKEHGYEPTGYAAEWRKSVRASKVKLVLTEGQEIMLYGTEYTVGEPREGGTYFIWMKGTSAKFHLPKRMFKHVLIATQNPGV